MLQLKDFVVVNRRDCMDNVIPICPVNETVLDALKLPSAVPGILGHGSPPFAIQNTVLLRH